MTSPQTAIASSLTDALEDRSDNDNKFLTFCLGQEEYGVVILKVREIIGIIGITPVPQLPEYVKGVINLRGKIIPVIELRTKFAMPSVEYTEATCVIVVEVSDEMFLVRRPGEPDEAGFSISRNGDWSFLAWEMPNTRIPGGRLWVSDDYGLRSFLPPKR